MICSNIDCKKEFIPKRSFAEYCNKKCAKKAYYLDNKDKIKDLNRLYYLNNIDKAKEYYLNNKENLKQSNRLYKLNNKDKSKEYQKEYNLNNRNLLNAREAKRRAIKLNATPRFADLKKIKEIYRNCPKGYQVDHIIPLTSKLVCGLHVHWNLQYLTAHDNRTKSNKLII
jgi:preprotein translocase subunit SecA